MISPISSGKLNPSFPQVSYRIGEKGSVKILYSENESAFGSSPGISPGLHTSSSTSSGASDDLNAEIAAYLPPPPPQQQQQPPQQPPQQVGAKSHKM